MNPLPLAVEIVVAVLLAALIYFAATGATSLHEILIVALVFLTAPVSAHLLVKAAQKLDPSLRRAPPPPGNDRKPQ